MSPVWRPKRFLRTTFVAVGAGMLAVIAWPHLETHLLGAPVDDDNYTQAGPYGTTPYTINQLNPGTPVQPGQATRPAGWPGGPGAAETAPPARSRRAFAAPLNSPTQPGNSTLPKNTPRSVTGAPATTPPPGTVSTAVPPAGVPTATRQPVRVANSRPVDMSRLPGTEATSSAATPPAESVPVARTPSFPKQFEGPEIVARVGSEVIQASELMFDTDRMIQRIMESNPGREFPKEVIAKARLGYMQKFLERAVETKLFLVAGKRKIPTEAWPKIEGAFTEQFDKIYLKNMIDSEDCVSRTELEFKLRKQGTSIEALRRQAFESNFAQHWFAENVKVDDEITHDEMRAYYLDHITDYESPPRVRWEHLMARFDKFDTKAEAYKALAQWGNQVQQGAEFDKVAKAHSQDISASEGGLHSWTTQGSLVSVPLDKAIFELPVDSLSQIIEDERGFHIVRVIEREEFRRIPFVEAQAGIVARSGMDKRPPIKAQIREERTADRRKEYLDKLRAQTPVWTIFDGVNIDDL